MNCAQAAQRRCSADELRRACGSFPTGVTVTTSLGADGQPRGVTVGSFTSVSLDPPLVLVCIDHRSKIIPYLPLGCVFGVNILNDRQQALSRRFAGGWSQRFEGVAWRKGLTGAPLLPEVAATLECSAAQLFPLGDHIVVVGQVICAEVSEAAPLVYFRREYRVCASGRSA